MIKVLTEVKTSDLGDFWVDWQSSFHKSWGNCRASIYVDLWFMIIYFKALTLLEKVIFIVSSSYIWLFIVYHIDRYRRGLETCPQAKTSKSGHAIFFSFSDASERRVWLSAESKIFASTFGRIRLYRLIIRKFSTFPISGMILPFSDRAPKS